MAFAPIAMVALAAVGTAVSAYGAMSQAAAASKAADYNSQIAARNAQIANQEAQSNADVQQRQDQQKLGAITAAYGAGNVTMAGSPVDVLGNVAANQELNRQNIIYQGHLKAIGFTDTSNLDAVQSQTAMTQGITSAAGDLFSGGANVIRMTLPGGQTMPGTSPMQMGG